MTLALKYIYEIYKKDHTLVLNARLKCYARIIIKRMYEVHYNIRKALPVEALDGGGS